MLFFLQKKHYISKLSAEVGFSNSKSKTYSKVTHSIVEVIQANYCQKLDLNIAEPDKTLPVVRWLPKMDKTAIGARFIVVSKIIITNLLSGIISKIFEMNFNTVKNFHNKIYFQNYICYKKFWALQNSFPIVTELNKIGVSES